MKILLISMIIIAVIVTVVMTTLTYFTLQNNLEKQNQEEQVLARVHATANLTSGEDYHPFKFVKISDFPPNPQWYSLIRIPETKQLIIKSCLIGGIS